MLTSIPYAGLTEACTTVCLSSPHDICLGSVGSLLPGFQAKIVLPNGSEVTEYEKPGELWLQSPSNILGYLGNGKETEATFVLDSEGGRWLRTGDIVMVRQSPKGYEHYWVLDRIKEMIKSKVRQRLYCKLRLTLLSSLTNFGRRAGTSSRPSRVRVFLT